jgi:histone acetyltransferase MYST1
MQGTDSHDHAHTHPILPRFIEVVDFGDYELHTWYHSPLPPPFGTMRHLFICPFTLKYFRKRRLLDAHIAAIPEEDRHPPGFVPNTHHLILHLQRLPMMTA